MQIDEFLKIVYENLNERNILVCYLKTTLTLLHTGVIGNPKNYQYR